MTRSKLDARLEKKGAALHFEICKFRELQLMAVAKFALLDAKHEANRAIIRSVADLLIAATSRGRRNETKSIRGNSS